MIAISPQKYELLFKIDVQLRAEQDHIIENLIANGCAKDVRKFLSFYNNSLQSRVSCCDVARKEYHTQWTKENENSFVWSPSSDWNWDWCVANCRYCQF